MQVYKHMNVGSAKTPVSQREVRLVHRTTTSADHSYFCHLAYWSTADKQQLQFGFNIGYEKTRDVISTIFNILEFSALASCVRRFEFNFRRRGCAFIPADTVHNRTDSSVMITLINLCLFVRRVFAITCSTSSPQPKVCYPSRILIKRTAMLQ